MDKIEVVYAPQNETDKSIEAGLRDLQDIISGNTTGKPLTQLLGED